MSAVKASSSSAAGASNQANSLEQLSKLRHTCEHVLTYAMHRLYGRDKIVMAMGPATDDGFYFDFDLSAEAEQAGFKISEEQFPKIEKEMQKLIDAGLKMQQVEVEPRIARRIFADNPYKQEWLDGIEQAGEKASLYLTGTPEQLKNDSEVLSNLSNLNEENEQKESIKIKSFVDLCSGPHLDSTDQIKAFKLLSVAGAYWHGDEKNKMLNRIYGTAFFSQEELDAYLARIEQAKLNDHRKLGQEMELFMVDDEVGQGLIMWLPKGAFVRHKVQEFALNTYLARGYQPVVTPHIASSALWQHSGHLDFYSESMYNPLKIDEEEYRLKPMNCPFHIKMYQHRPRSYKELAIRWTEMGTVYRYEKSGTLHGLARVRGFTQDDAHIICTPEQLQEELVGALELTLYILRTFGFQEFEMNLSTRGTADKSKFVGEDANWQKAEAALKQAMKKVGYENYVLDEGGAAFYGPKIDIKVADSLGRMWQLSTIQLDFNLPGRFKMTYVGQDGQQHEPFMIHRALLGSLERFMGVYIEHTGGKFPVWLAPVQAKILPITDEQLAYAQELAAQFKQAGLRVEVDDQASRLQAKIRNAQLEKVPYMLVVGKKEVENKQVTVRSRDSQEQVVLSAEEFIKQVKEQEVSKK